MLGRLASIVAKQLLSGQRIVVVRSEEINISGNFYRAKLKFKNFFRKRSVVNQRHGGNIHYRAPSRIFWRTVRGMIPHKTARGAAALERLKCFEGIPETFAQKKRLIVPAALRSIRLKPGTPFCSVGRVSQEFGWKYAGIIASLEEKRKALSAAYFEKKQQMNVKIEKALSSDATLAPVVAQLKTLGY